MWPPNCILLNSKKETKSFLLCQHLLIVTTAKIFSSKLISKTFFNTKWISRHWKSCSSTLFATMENLHEEKTQKDHLNIDMESTRFYGNNSLLASFPICPVLHFLHDNLVIVLTYRHKHLFSWPHSNTKAIKEKGVVVSKSRTKPLSAPEDHFQDPEEPGTSEIWESVLLPCGQLCFGRRLSLPLWGNAICWPRFRFFCILYLHVLAFLLQIGL